MEKKFDSLKKSLKRTFGRKVGREVELESQKAEEAHKQQPQQENEQAGEPQQHQLQHQQQDEEQQQEQPEQQQQHEAREAEDLPARPKQSGSWLKRTFGRKVAQQVQAELQKKEENEQRQQQGREAAEDPQANPRPILPTEEALSEDSTYEQAAAFAAPAVPGNLQAAATSSTAEDEAQNVVSLETAPPRRFRMRTRLAGFEGWDGFPLRTLRQLHQVPVPEVNELERWGYHHVLPDMVSLMSARVNGAVVQTVESGGAQQDMGEGSAIQSAVQSAVQSTCTTQSSVVELSSLDTFSDPQEPGPRGRGRFATWSCGPRRGSGNWSSSPPAPPRPQIPVSPVQESEDLRPAPLQTDVADGRGPSTEALDQDAENVQGEERKGGGAEAEGAEDLPAEALQPHVSAISSIQTARRAHPPCNTSNVVEDLQGSYRHNSLPRRAMTHEQAQEKLRQVRVRINALQRAAPAVAEGRRRAGEERQQELESRVVEGLQAEREEETPLERTELSATLGEEVRQVMLHAFRGSALITQGQAREEQTTNTAQLARKPTDALCGDTEDDAEQTERARGPELGGSSSRPPEPIEDLPAAQTSMGPEPGVWFSSSSSSRPRNTRVNPDNAPGTPEAFTAAVNTAVAESGFDDEQMLPGESRGEVLTPSSLRTPSRLQTMHSSPARGRHGNRDSSSARDDPEARARSVRQWFVDRERRKEANGTSSCRAGPSRPRLVLRSRYRIRGSAMSDPHGGRVEDGAGTSSSQDEDRTLLQTGTPAESGQAEPASVETAMPRSEDAEDLQAGPADREESDNGSVGRASMEVVARSSMESIVTTVYRGPDT